MRKSISDTKILEDYRTKSQSGITTKSIAYKASTVYRYNSLNQNSEQLERKTITS